MELFSIKIRCTFQLVSTIKVHNILVFDHNGHFLANLHTDRSASRLSVSDDEKTIYAVTEEPEIAIVRFDISNILK